MTYNDETIQALAGLRAYAEKYPTMGLSGLINTLDNAGVFAALDEQTDYAPAVEILAEAAVIASRPLDPAEWGDTTAADVARHQGWERVPGTDTLRPARQALISEALRRDEVEQGVPDDTTAALPFASCTCGRPKESSPALHDGVCPVWARHHGLNTRLERVPGTDVLRPRRS